MPPDEDGDNHRREIDTLSRFFSWLEDRPDVLILHWNMNSSAYGFEALALRYRYITGDFPIYRPTQSRLHDLDALIESRFGDEYAKHPKLPNIVALNGIRKRSFLEGAEEAEMFAAGDIGAVRRSVSEKVRIISKLFELLLSGTIKTQNSVGSVLFAGTELDAVSTVLELGKNFRYVERSLLRRHNGRATLKVDDEYDAQDLLRSLLRVFFNNVNDEVWMPSYAGGASRVDFVLPDYQLAIELKYTRNSITDKSVGDQLIIDRDRYKQEARINHLLCLVFDHDGILHNPRGLEKDLGRDSSAEGLAVTVRIYDR